METAEKAGDEKALNMLRQQESQLERMKWLILSLLQMTRIEADAVPFEMQEVPADVLLKLAMEPLEQMAEKKNIKFVIENQSEENAKNYVLTDPEWMREALVNIMKNAIEYSPENSEIQLGVSATPFTVVLSVLDHGPGIAEGDRLNIFKRFYKANGHAVNPTSVGIGLALSRSIIEKCKGHIYVESRTAPEKNTFTKMVIVMPVQGVNLEDRQGERKEERKEERK